MIHYTAEGQFIQAWGGKSHTEGQFGRWYGGGLAVTSNGDVYIADVENDRVQQFTAQGDFIRSWGKKEFYKKGNYDGPKDIVIAPDGKVYITNVNSRDIHQFSPQGNFIQTLDRGTSLSGIDIGSDGSIYISAFDSIRKLNSQGQLIQEWTSSGKALDQFDEPTDIALSQDEKSVYVVDSSNNRIQQFDLLGKLIRTWGKPESIAVSTSNNNVYVLDSYNDRVQQFTAEGKFIRMWGKKGSKEGEFTIPRGIAVAPDGNIYISDADNSNSVARIQQFTAEGQFIRSWGKFGSKVGELHYPTDIVVASDGTVYVNDIGNSRVQKFTAEGIFLKIIETNFPSSITALAIDRTGKILVSPRYSSISNGGMFQYNDNGGIYQYNDEDQFVQILESGTGEGQVDKAEGMVMASDGTLYIADTSNNRIQKMVPRSKLQTATHAYKAIILAGGGKTFSNGRTNHIWGGTKRITKKAYKALTNQGFKQQKEIKFLTAGGTNFDVDGNGKTDDYEVATKASLHQAITQWASDAKDVIIFLANHGGPGKFQVNGSEVLTADELNLWITELEQKIPGTVTVIIEACNSAAFFNQLASPNRYLLASAKADQPAVISNDGLNSFSYYLWSEISTGAYLKDAFKDARQGMSTTKVARRSQNAQAETDGNHTFNAQDLETMGTYCLGNCNKTAAAAPIIDPLSPATQTLKGNSQQFSITVSHLQPISRAWASIQRPDDISIDPNEPLIFKKIALTCTEQGTKSVCQGHYDQFDRQGEYFVSFYVQDKNEEISFPETLVLMQTQGKVVNAVHYDEQQDTFYVRDVTSNGLHFQAVLKKQGIQYVAFAVQPIAESFASTATFSAINQSLIFPHMNMSGKDYHLTFDYLGGLDFSLKSKILK